MKKLIRYNELFKKGAQWREPCQDHLGYDILFWSQKEGSHVYGSVNCISSTQFGGRCQCNSHDTWEERLVSIDEAVKILRKWDIYLEEDPQGIDIQKTRRRVEDRLRKDAKAVLTAAGVLGVDVALR